LREKNGKNESWRPLARNSLHGHTFFAFPARIFPFSQYLPAKEETQMTTDAEGSNQAMGKYPLLESLLTAKGLPDKGVWSIGDVAEIFGVRNRAIYDWVANGKLAIRDLPGRGRFLSEDLEEFLKNSKRLPKGRNVSRGDQ
jgi:hypothetical protein